MKTIGCCILVLALVLVLTSTSYANPSGDMKPSPLFKASLEKSIAKLEGRVAMEDLWPENAAEPATQRPGCVQPNLQPTVYGDETCEPNCVPGGPTLHVTCSTCQGWPTCDNTCAATCGNQPTCSTPSSCIGCSNPTVSGTVYKMPWWSSYWPGSWGRRVYEVQTGLGSSFGENGYYWFYCSIAARTLRADAHDASGRWEGYAFKPSSNLNQRVDIQAYRQP